MLILTDSAFAREKLSIMAAHVPMDQPCGECRSCSSPTRTLESHPAFLTMISNSPTDGINFKANEFTANQIADAFTALVPGHMDWQIKESAVERWNTLLPGFLDGPDLRESEFDLQAVYRVLDDFFFLRALQDSCLVEWVDELLYVSGQPKIGWVVLDHNIRGPSMRIRMVRPSPEIPRSVHNVLCVLMHEMCHALLYLACECGVCACDLNMMNGWGITGHGPSWQRLRTVVEETANFHLKGFSEPFSFCSRTDFEVRGEAKARRRLLEGLYEKIVRDYNEVEWEQEEERNKKRTKKRTLHRINEINRKESDQRKANHDETLACVVAMFQEWGETANAIMDVNTENGASKGEPRYCEVEDGD